ncbi:chemotaxis protein CheB [Segetibacter sp. 3557_3]|uniref:chemotaxis protein CheB n=1 Tax=Segetibacter sp. 3557_3 TaxID=2547429 RepID=UPI001058F3B6|nr:chemotaxis protein CheB [Segetibacter sp. 3557_3]TDH27942.1 chemotaxis protein CheB [Segetibacter sp. 3557_3]
MKEIIIVALGFSAGGLNPLKKFFNAVLHDHVSYIILRHIPKGYQSALQEILQRHSKLTIVEATDGMKIKKDVVYITPPFAHMTVRNETLYLHTRRLEPGGNWAVDIFLNSLAETDGNRIAVILSGAGSDGSKGIVKLKSAGGLVLVQTPESCEHASMPENAIATGTVDYITEPGKMPEIIQQHVETIMDTLQPFKNNGTV